MGMDSIYVGRSVGIGRFGWNRMSRPTAASELRFLKKVIVSRLSKHRPSRPGAKLWTSFGYKLELQKAKVGMVMHKKAIVPSLSTRRLRRMIVLGRITRHK